MNYDYLKSGFYDNFITNILLLQSFSELSNFLFCTISLEFLLFG